MSDLAMLLLLLAKVPWEIIITTPQKTMIHSQVTLSNRVTLFNVWQDKTTSSAACEVGGLVCDYPQDTCGPVPQL